MRRVILCFGFLAMTVSFAKAQMALVVHDDFESGQGSWTPQVALPRPAELNGTPTLFTPTDARLYDNIDNPGSQSAGYTSDVDPFDGSLASWMEKRFVGVLAPGTYAVKLEMDVYVYKDPAYRLPTPPDPFATGIRILLLTDSGYDNPCLNFDGSLPAGAMRKSYWPGSGEATPSIYSGHWLHVTAFNTNITTTTGNFEFRLTRHDKYKGKQAVAWDNIVLTIGSFTFTEDFEAGMDGWTVKSYEANHPHDDAPVTFTPADSRLVTNTANPGTNSGGFFSDLTCVDNTRAAWLDRQFPALYPPGTYAVSIEADAYVYKDPAGTNGADPQALGSRIFVLTDDNFNKPDFAFDSADPSPGFATTLWSGDADGTMNGAWRHVSVLKDVTTATGNFEIRLLEQDKFQAAELAAGDWAKSLGKQAVAWDNVKVRIGPACYAPRFDRDGDGDVDQSDFAEYQLCFTGLNAAAIAGFEQCRCFNSDGDTDIDSNDANAFMTCLSGSMIPADPQCDDAMPPP